MTDSSQTPQFPAPQSLPRLSAMIEEIESHHHEGDEGVAGHLSHLIHAVLAASGLTDLADHLVGHFVDQARAAGASWAQIGECLGVSKQAVQQRFVLREPGTVADFEHSFTLKTAKGRFGRYTDRAKHCVHAAEEAARATANNEVGPVHLLLGLFAEPEGLAVKIIAALGAEPDAVRQAAIDALPPVQAVPDGPIPFKAEGRKVLDLAVREALRLGHNYVGTEHLLAALLVQEDEPVAILLAGAGVTYERFVLGFDRILQAHLASRNK
jgi:hypothetical protein